MNSHTEKISAATSWFFFLGSFVANNISTVVGVASGIAALVAAIYSIMVSRAKLKKLRERDDDY